MFNFKKQIRKSLYESIMESNGTRPQDMADELEYYSNKISGLKFSSEDEKRGEISKRKLLRVMGDLAKNIDIHIQYSDRPEILEKVPLPVEQFQNILRGAELLISKSTDANKKVGDDSDSAEKTDSNLSNMLFEPVDPSDRTKGFKSREFAPGSQASNIDMALKKLVADYSLLQDQPNSKNRKSFMSNLDNLVKALDNIKIESVDLDSILSEFEQRFKK